MISVRFQGNPFNITVIQIYAPSNNAEETEVERFYEDLQDLLELTPQKRCPFHYRGLKCKSKKLRNTWRNRQILLWNTDLSRSKAHRVLPIEHTGHSKHTLPTTQKKTLYMAITRWSIPKSDWLYYCSQRWRNSIQSAKTRQGANCGSDHELFIAKFRLKLKKVGTTPRPFRYDVNPVPYNNPVEVINRFKVLDLIDWVPDNYEQRFVTLYRRSDQNHPKEIEMQQVKMVVWGSLTNSYEKKRSERSRKKGKLYPFKCIVPKNIKQR